MKESRTSEAIGWEERSRTQRRRKQDERGKEKTEGWRKETRDELEGRSGDPFTPRNTVQKPDTRCDRI